MENQFSSKNKQFHRGFSAKMEQSRAYVWKFISIIQTEQSLIENKLTDTPAKFECKVALNKRIFEIFSNYWQCWQFKIFKKLALIVKWNLNYLNGMINGCISLAFSYSGRLFMKHDFKADGQESKKREGRATGSISWACSCGDVVAGLLQTMTR